jgi:NTE family protein
MNALFSTSGDHRPTMGLVLTGGGAKAAFQIGVIQGIHEALGAPQENPFQVIAGASAGAINGTILAAYAHRFPAGLRRLSATWENFHVEQVYETHFSSLMKNTGRWLRHFLRSPSRQLQPISLFNNEPLKQLLQRVIPFEQIQQNITEGHLRALSVTAFGYASGESISFFQAPENQSGWQRYRRAGVRSFISLRHLMASSAIPVVFPAVRVHREYFGDGSIGLLSPISPALHLGADKLVVISTEKKDRPANWRQRQIHYPSFAEIGGKLMDSIFTDSLAADLERLDRVNHTLELIPGRVLSKHKVPLRKIDYLTFAPEVEVADLACEAFDSLPSLLRFFLARAGMDSEHGGDVLGFLMFESQFTRRLIEHGRDQVMRRQDEVRQFFALR